MMQAPDTCVEAGVVQCNGLGDNFSIHRRVSFQINIPIVDYLLPSANERCASIPMCNRSCLRRSQCRSCLIPFASLAITSHRAVGSSSLMPCSVKRQRSYLSTSFSMVAITASSGCPFKSRFSESLNSKGSCEEISHVRT